MARWRRFATVVLTFIAALPASSGCGGPDTKTYRGNGFTFAYPARWRLMGGIAAPLPNPVLRAQRRFVGVDGQGLDRGVARPGSPDGGAARQRGTDRRPPPRGYAAFMAKIQTARHRPDRAESSWRAASGR